jgi:hypothetical protein
MNKFICIHGHFYQPPRENPWLEAVELQDSAFPYHDWNERVTDECYAPNVHARLLDGGGRIERMANNYSKISFNFGPTLLSWMSEKTPDILEEIVAADKEIWRVFFESSYLLAAFKNRGTITPANKCQTGCECTARLRSRLCATVDSVEPGWFAVHRA